MAERPADLLEAVSAGCRTLADDTLRLTIDIEPRDARRAFDLFGERGARLVIARLRNEAQAAPEDEDEDTGTGAFWRDLIAGGFFRAPPVLKAIGPEQYFEDWIRGQPSCVSSKMDYDDSGQPRNQCCHVRSVSEGAGTAYKPPYFAVPMTAEEHRTQHDKGYSAVMPEGLPWFNRQANHYRSEWASKRLAWTLVPGAQSRSEASPDLVRAWVRENDLDIYLPGRCR